MDKKDIKFILIHFSKKYSWNEIKQFFDEINKTTPLTNVILWLHTEIINYANNTSNINKENLPWIHSTIFEPHGSYNILDDTYKKCIELYENAIVPGHKPYITDNENITISPNDIKKVENVNDNIINN